MEYHGDLLRHYIRNYWYEVGTKLDDVGTKVDDLDTKFSPKVIKYIDPKLSAALCTAGGCIWS